MCLWSCLSYLERTLVFPCAYACDFLCAYDSQVWTGAYLGYRIFNSSSVTAPELPPTEDRLRATFIMQIASRDCLLSQKRSEPSHHSWRTSPKIVSCFHTSQYSWWKLICGSQRLRATLSQWRRNFSIHKGRGQGEFGDWTKWVPECFFFILFGTIHSNRYLLDNFCDKFCCWTRWSRLQYFLKRF